jgi:2-amino-4-hydroxy-6-hydroxymethyldihydropteridine diphosphokinase
MIMGDTIVYIGLGSNRGDRMAHLEKAMERIADRIGKICLKSSVYATEPWGYEDDRFFLNMALEVETLLSPASILLEIRSIEQELGRIRGVQGYQGRTIDIDILFYNDLVIRSTDLVIPHPLLQERKFVLVPLAEIAGNYIHPVFNKSVATLLNECPDQKQVNKAT